MKGFIQSFDEDKIYIECPFNPIIISQKCTSVDVLLNDGRRCSDDQKRKIWAILGDIALYNGDDKKTLHIILKEVFCNIKHIDMFSLSNVDVSTMCEYISFLIEFCLIWDIPCYDTLLNRTDDISKYLWLCLYYKKCAICGKKSEYHHATGSRIGMGRNRKEVPIIGTNGFSLCRIHHDEIHKSEMEFCDKYHVYATKINNDIMKKWKEKQP